MMGGTPVDSFAPRYGANRTSPGLRSGQVCREVQVGTDGRVPGTAFAPEEAVQQRCTASSCIGGIAASDRLRAATRPLPRPPPAARASPQGHHATDSPSPGSRVGAESSTSLAVSLTAEVSARSCSTPSGGGASAAALRPQRSLTLPKPHQAAPPTATPRASPALTPCCRPSIRPAWRPAPQMGFPIDTLHPLAPNDHTEPRSAGKLSRTFTAKYASTS